MRVNKRFKENKEYIKKHLSKLPMFDKNENQNVKCFVTSHRRMFTRGRQS